MAELQEELFAWQVVVGIHVERGVAQGFELLQHLYVFGLQERCRGNGDGLVARREHSPAVGTSLRDEERFVGLQERDDLQIVDGASGAIGKAKAWFFGLGFMFLAIGFFRLILPIVEVAVLYADELSLLIVVWRLQPMRAVAVGP